MARSRSRDDEADSFKRVPRQGGSDLDPNAAYVHMTSNNTIYGTEWHWLPEAGSVPLVSDMSSDIFSRPVDVEKHALIYAGAQKNLAPAGVTLAIIREDLLPKSPASLHTMLSYAVHAENQSMYNTPPVFSIYVMRLVMTWLLKNGGLEAMDAHNQRKADKLYGEIDRTGYYRGHAHKDARSRHERHLPAAERGPRKEVSKRKPRGRAAASRGTVRSGHEGSIRTPGPEARRRPGGL